MSFSIFTDTSANLPTPYAKEHDIGVIPLSYIRGGKELTCLDTESFDSREYYAALKNGEKVTTSQINPQKYEEYMEETLKSGKDILFVGMSSGISGSYNSAAIAAEQLLETYVDRKICMVDSLGASLGEGMLVLEAVECREKGMSLQETCDHLNEMRHHIYQLFTVDDLMFLRRRRDLMRNREKIAGQLFAALSVLDGDDMQAGASRQAEIAAQNAQAAAALLPQVQPVAQQLEDAAYSLQDAAETLRACSETLSFDPAEMAEIEERLDFLYRLSLKYGETEEEMLAFLENARQELAGIAGSDEQISALELEFDQIKAQAIALAKELSAARRTAAAEFSQRVREELSFLNMPRVVFKVEQVRTPLHSLGCDKIQFLISTNPGEEPRPMAKIASGGELSRIMLAIKTVLAGSDDIGTFIFDEIDTGISGLSARRVGQKLKEVSRSHQVLCVTHLAQIAAMGNSHFLIRKEVKEDRTYTHVQALDFEERKRELARIVSGGEITPLRLKMAEEMLRGEDGRSDGFSGVY